MVGHVVFSARVHVFCSHRSAGGDLDPSAGSCQRGPEGSGSSRSYGEPSPSWFCVGGGGGGGEGGRGTLCKVFQHLGQRQRISKGPYGQWVTLLPSLPPHKLPWSQRSHWPHVKLPHSTGRNVHQPDLYFFQDHFETSHVNLLPFPTRYYNDTGK